MPDVPVPPSGAAVLAALRRMAALALTDQGDVAATLAELLEAIAGVRARVEAPDAEAGLDAESLLAAFRHGSTLIAGSPGTTPRLLLAPTGGATARVLALEETQDARLSRERLELVLTLADQAAAALAAREARASARLDPLTGLLNHGAMQAALGEEVARAARTATDLSCLMLDVDHFKGVNDHHGHPVGDLVLRRVAGALRSHSRPYDRACRYGGDEFVVLLPTADLADAVQAAERFRAGIAAAVADLTGLGISIAASAGVAQWSPGQPPSALLEAADRALLEAKHAGRDSVRGGGTG